MGPGEALIKAREGVVTSCTPDGNCTPGCSASSVYMESEAKGVGWDTSVYGGPFDPPQLRQCRGCSQE